MLIGLLIKTHHYQILSSFHDFGYLLWNKLLCGDMEKNTAAGSVLKQHL